MSDSPDTGRRRPYSDTPLYDETCAALLMPAELPRHRATGPRHALREDPDEPRYADRLWTDPDQLAAAEQPWKATRW